jgi:LacI family transcriptional regulator
MPPARKKPSASPPVQSKPARGDTAFSPPKRRTLLLHFDYFDALTYQGVVDWVREHGWTLDAAATRSLQLPRVEKVDGILAIIMQRRTPDWLRQFGCPIVRMHTPNLPEVLERCSDFAAVECDFESIGQLGAQHLLGLGQPHFVFYQRGDGPDVKSLRDSFVKTIRAAGHEPSVLNFAADHPVRNPARATSFEQRFTWLARHLARLPKPMAIMAEDDRFAPDVVAVARKLNLRVPDDVAVLGCDDSPLALGVSPIPISSVDTNCRGVGHAGADLVARLVAGGRPPSATVRVTARRVISRQSTATYAGANPGVNLALRHLRQHFRRPLTMESLARVARLSVRSLQIAYREEVGGTLQDELTRLRVAAAERLLEETDLKLDAVAADTNLGDAKNLCRVFAKVHGVSPDAWRRRGRSGR